MGMSIDDSIELFEDNFTVIDTHGHYTEEEETQATAIAIDTMGKYQKIQEIIADWESDGGAFEMSESYWLRLISEVTKYGNDD